MEGRIVFGGVADTTGLRAYHSDASDVVPIIQALVGSIDFHVDQKRSFGAHPRSKDHTIQYVVENEVAYISAATSQFPHRICFKFLQNLMEKNHGGDATSARGKPAFEKFIRERMKFYSEDPEADQIRALNKQVDEVKNIMHSNIEAVLNRGESLEGIMTRAEDLEDKSVFFKKTSKAVKCAMIRDHIKVTIILIVIILCILAVLGTGLGLMIYFLVK